MTQESNKTLCRICGELKDRILVGKYNKKDKKYQGTDGTLWTGLKCPDCVRMLARERQKRIRSSHETE